MERDLLKQRNAKIAEMVQISINYWFSALAHLNVSCRSLIQVMERLAYICQHCVTALVNGFKITKLVLWAWGPEKDLCESLL